MAGLPSAPADWNHEQAHVLRSPFPALELVKIEAVGQHYQVFQSRKQTSRTFSEQERYEQATGPVTAEDELLSDDEEESADLLDLDPKDWKNQDHYAVMGLSKLRYKAKEDDIKKAFRKKVLKHHPDKKAQSGGSVDDDDFFKCVQKAFEILTDPVQRLHFDSVDPEFDDSIPSEKEVNLKNFYKVLGPVFKRNARFSKKQPVPLLGDENSSPKEVDHFYNFWYNFDSWRVFNYLDEEDSMSRESREDKRYIERKNLKARAERKKEDNARIRQLTDIALKYDVRLKKFKDQDKEKKEAAKKAQEEAKILQEEAAKKAQEEAKLKKQKEEEIQKAKAEEEKKEKEAKKNNLRKFRKNIRQIVKDCNYYLPATVSAESQEVINGMIQLDKLCDDSTYEELSKLNDLAMKDPATFHEVYQTELRRFFDEKELPPKIESSKLVSEVKVEKPWTSEEVAFLIQAVNLFPGGTTQRWEKIAAHVNEHSKSTPRTVKDVTQEAGKIKQNLESGKAPEIETSKIVKKHNDTLIKDAPTQRFDEGSSQPAKPEPKGKGKEPAKPEAKPAAGKQAAKQPEAKPAAAAKQNEAKPAAATKQAEAKPAAAAKPAEGERAEEEDDKDDKEEGGKPWSKEEQQALETALRNFPASVEGRWEKIAAAVGTRSKKDCMQRCKKLAQKIKEKKGN